ncbi:CPBP family intramembrane glutamic endopeptidase [Gordonia aurantiaca]|uniref:CPBP family intramembrane glutamic endopeptidase n=1 Tax=Gordonia sp. B21 TaxID=3151852 RepID=UPI003265C023
MNLQNDQESIDLRRFWIALVATTIPFYLWGALVGGTVTIGGGELSVSALMFISPAFAASAAGGIGPIRRMCTSRPGLVAVGVAVAAPAVTTLGSSSALAGVWPTVPGSLWYAALLFVIAAFCEELGWTAVLMPRLLKRQSAVTTGVAIGAVWALWHLLPYLQSGYSATDLMWQLAFSVVFRVVLVQLTIQGASAPILAVLGHASYNVAWAALDANDTYSPAAATMAMGLLAVLLSRWPRFSRDEPDHGGDPLQTTA